MSFMIRPSILDVCEVANRIRISPDQDQLLRSLLAANSKSSVLPDRRKGDFMPPVREIELEAAEIVDSAENVLAVVLRTRVNANSIPGLSLNGQPFTVKGITYSVNDIHWRAGQNWPLYTTQCPTNMISPAMFAPGAFAHQIMTWIPGVGFGMGCSGTSFIDFPGTGRLHALVNDDLYDDNVGTFELVVHNFWL